MWAVENSRDAIFEAVRRKETFATSGPRIKIRLFGGWDYDETICGSSDLAAQGYASGVPMGGHLPESEQAGAPVFVAQAEWDAGTLSQGGTPLERLQIIKGWLDGDGELRERVVHVAGNETTVATVDTSTCERSGEGHETLCARWVDPDFDPSERAFYYARAIENPTCRWSTKNAIHCRLTSVQNHVKKHFRPRSFKNEPGLQPFGTCPSSESRDDSETSGLALEEQRSRSCHR